jgi:glycine amidinotransferase
MISTNDNHLDGSITCLRPGVFLIRSDYLYIKDALPSKFKKWKFIVADNLSTDIDYSGLTDASIQIASSEGMDINVLSIDENTVMVNKRAIALIKQLEYNNFNVIPIELDYGEIFGGGIHCSTLDVERNDEYVCYT